MHCRYTKIGKKGMPSRARGERQQCNVALHRLHKCDKTFCITLSSFAKKKMLIHLSLPYSNKDSEFIRNPDRNLFMSLQAPIIINGSWHSHVFMRLLIDCRIWTFEFIRHTNQIPISRYRYVSVHFLKKWSVNYKIIK